MTTDEMMTIAREVAAGGKLPNKPALREFMAALVGAPAPSAEPRETPEQLSAMREDAEREPDASDEQRELRHLRIENGELSAAVEQLEAALTEARGALGMPLVKAFADSEGEVLPAVAAALPKIDPAALLGLGDFDAHACPALIERTSTGNIFLTSVPSQLSPADAMALARDLVREARA